MLQRIRESLALLLLALLPFHAFFVTVGTKLLVGSNHAPLTALTLWKEAVLGIILVIAVWEMVVGGRLSGVGKNLSTDNRQPTTDIIDWLIGALLVLSLVVTAATHGDWKLYLFGFKYDFVPLVAFLVLRRVSWSDIFMKRAFVTLIITGGIVACFGIMGMYLPQEFFVRLGYSDLHSLYRPNAPLAAFQQIGGSGIRRMQSVMSGPNQLGLWLLLPLSVLLTRKKVVSCRLSVVSMFIVIALLLSLSRSAVLAAGVIVTILLWNVLNKKMFISAMLSVLAAASVGGIVLYQFSPDLIVRAASSRGHISRPLEAIGMIMRQPLGYGLGTAGPASNRVSDTCVHLEDGADASWASDRPELCVFVGDTQVQPEAPCSCPFLPENWYLQIGIEMGVLGLLLYVVTIGVLIRRLFVTSFIRINEVTNNQLFTQSITLALLGVSIAALFLHAWEDAAIAYTVWLLVAVVTPQSERQDH